MPCTVTSRGETYGPTISRAYPPDTEVWSSHTRLPSLIGQNLAARLD